MLILTFKSIVMEHKPLFIIWIIERFNIIFTRNA